MAKTCIKKLTSLGKPIFTKLATSDSLNGSPEAACGWAGVGAEELEEPAFGSEVSMLCSAADLGWGNVTSGPSVLCFIFLISPASRSFCLLCFIFLISPASRLFSFCYLARASASCLSSRLPASLAEAFKAAASPSSPDPAPDSLWYGLAR